MDTEKARKIEAELHAKIIEGLKSGKLRAEAVTDSDGDIIKAIVTPLIQPDPRRSVPGRWRKARPL